jgi:hypothetical protein
MRQQGESESESETPCDEWRSEFLWRLGYTPTIPGGRPCWILQQPPEASQFRFPVCNVVTLCQKNRLKKWVRWTCLSIAMSHFCFNITAISIANFVLPMQLDSDTLLWRRSWSRCTQLWMLPDQMRRTTLYRYQILSRPINPARSIRKGFGNQTTE